MKISILFQKGILLGCQLIKLFTNLSFPLFRNLSKICSESVKPFAKFGLLSVCLVVLLISLNTCENNYDYTKNNESPTPKPLLPFFLGGVFTISIPIRAISKPKTVRQIVMSIFQNMTNRP